ncbi:MAG: bifunctional rhamnulose-1-phosphate aldolase/short-chain dehydrogenase [Bacteroidetes bacterium]|nr:bifunctional rhamnulose-1-phosphate aldolase/short-chain dehydrogenase [Bacteroidota bacterium]
MINKNLVFLEDKWDKDYSSTLAEPERLRYRSNLLGSDLRITNFGGGNTSSKIEMEDILSDTFVDVLWVKGSGGDLGSIKRNGFATLYMDKFTALDKKYKGVKDEDEMLEFYPLCTFGLNPSPASIDTPLHGMIPYKNVDHMHPDWAIAIAASANGQQLLKEFNKEFGYHLVWLPWQRPGYQLGTMLKDVIYKNPKAEGAILGSHGLINWNDDHYGCYRLTLEIIDSMGEFVVSRIKNTDDKIFGGQKYQKLENRKWVAEQILPTIRGYIGKEKFVIGSYIDLPEVLRFVNSNDGEKLAFMGTSCPDHFIRTKVRPMYINWNPQSDDINKLRSAIAEAFRKYEVDYKNYYENNKEEDSPAVRGLKPTVVLVPGVGMFSFGKNKKESRITGEFYVNAIHVIEGATSMNTGKIDKGIEPERICNNYVSLSPNESFRIEYWALEEAKIKRQPKEKESARKIAIVIGGGSGIGREFCLKLASEGAQVAVADIDFKAAAETVNQLHDINGLESAFAVEINITDRQSVKEAYNKVIIEYGGLDILINTAAVFIPPDKDGKTYNDETWAKTFKINITSNYILIEEFAEIIKNQNTYGTVLLTSSANAVVPKSGSEPYDISKAAINHLIRELAIRYSPMLRINGVSPATVIEGSKMFPRDRVISSLAKYQIKFDNNKDTESLRKKLAEFYAQRTLLNKEVRPIDIVEAGYHLISEKSNRTTGHIIPVDGGLKEAFLR